MFNTGDTVTASYRGAWSGVVLAKNDVRAWSGTFFCADTPSQEDVNKHLEYIAKEITPLYPNEPERIPVAWEFGKIYWERVNGLELVK